MEKMFVFIEFRRFSRRRALQGNLDGGSAPIGNFVDFFGGFLFVNRYYT